MRSFSSAANLIDCSGHTPATVRTASLNHFFRVLWRFALTDNAKFGATRHIPSIFSRLDHRGKYSASFIIKSLPQLRTFLANSHSDDADSRTKVNRRRRLHRSACFETRSLPKLTRSYPRRFTFYVADPSAPLSVVVTDRQALAMSWPCSRRKVATTIASVGSIEIVPAARASYSFFLRLDDTDRFGVDKRGKRISDRRRVRYPWAMAPTINTTKLVATAIATFVSTDKFIILPSIMRPPSMTPF